jgi:outer membrane protein assembly factor BamA
VRLPVVVALLAALAAVRPALAQAPAAPAAPADEPTPPPTPTGTTEEQPEEIPPEAASGDADAPAPAAPEGVVPEGVAASTPPAQWSDWTIEGKLIDSDSPEALRAVFEPEMRTHRALTEAAQADLAAAFQRYGYQLVRFETQPQPAGGARVVLHVEPIPVIRQVNVHVRAAFLTRLVSVSLDDDLRRRMRLRESGTLPWDAGARQTELDEEGQRIAEYLRDAGFFDATVSIRVDDDDDGYGLIVHIVLDLGKPYRIGTIAIAGERDLAIDGKVLREVFQPKSWCNRLCPHELRRRFTRAEHQAALQTIASMFRNRGYPAVKVSSDFDPATSFNRRTHTVDFTLTIDQRRYIDVVFEGNDKDRFSDEALRKRLTFTEAASADEFEVAASAAALHTYYQSRGYYDAIVTWTRESFRAFDRIVYRIDEGSRREFSGISFRVTPSDGRPAAMDDAALRSAVAAGKYKGGWFSAEVRPTATSIADDVERLRRAYRERGFMDAQITARVGPDPDALDSAALSGALLAAGRRKRDLYVRFDIVEGPRTYLDQVRITFEGPHTASCADILREVGGAIGIPDLADKAIPSDPCIAAGLDVPSLPEQLEGAGGKLKDYYWRIGRPRAEIQFRVAPGPTRPTATIADYRVREREEVRIGKVLVRGNFRTKTWVIRDELDFDEGERLTADVYGRGPAQLRTTGLFNMVNVELANFEETSDGTVNVVVRVEERHVGRGWVISELGYSTLKGVFIGVQPVFPNLPSPFEWMRGVLGGRKCRMSCGIGLQASANVTLGFQEFPFQKSFPFLNYAYGSADLSLRAPRWIARRLVGLAFDTELAVFLREQETERFGRLTTFGGSLAATKGWQRLRTENKPARSIAWTMLRYDFRHRNRDEDAIRPAGADIDESRVPVPTTTAAIGTEIIWDQRTDRVGNLSPLVPERGFQISGGVSYAHPVLSLGFGDDTFIKAFASGQAYRTVSNRVLLRVDGRLDHGFPLGGAVLLPEVERYFAGGDTTVRGFEEDRLATEIIEAGVPPFGDVSQLRVLPAGGNIRALASIDAQIRVAQFPGTSLPIASAVFVDAGLVRNSWNRIQLDDIRPSIGLSLFRVLTPVGSFAVDYAVPMFPQLGDNPRGRLHISVALRN